MFLFTGFLRMGLPQDLENPTLRGLFDDLPHFLVRMREENTLKAYMVAYNGWSSWASHHLLQSLPANPLSFALYLLYNVQIGKTIATIKNVFYGIKFIHKGGHLPDPTKHQVVRNMYEAAKRICSKAIHKKEPLTTQHIQRIHDQLILNPQSLSSLRTFTLIVLGYCGFLRYSELSNLQMWDVIFCECYLKLFIEQSKTDIYRDGKWVHISAGNTECCPVKTLNSYIALAKLTPFSDEYLFRAIQTFPKQKKEELRRKNKPLSYSRAREIMLDAVRKIGYQKTSVCIVSIREVQQLLLTPV